MKIKNLLLFGALSVVALTSCVSENVDLDNVSKEVGALELNVDIVKPQTRAITEVDDFPVIIYDADGKLVNSYDAVSSVPAKIILNVGNYTVVSHTPGVIKKKMTSPYYSGSEDVEIINGANSEANVLCKMQNSVININYNDEFRDVFASWEITFDDGSETALSFDNTSSTAPIYWYFGEEGVAELKVNFRGTTKDGSTVVYSRVLKKDEAAESYDDDRANFCGGDALTLNFKPAESEDGKISSIVINADVTFTETNETVNVVVVDKSNMDDSGDEPNPGPGPGDDESITLNLPQNMTVNAATDKSLGDTYIKCDNNIKSIKVSIESTSSEMIESLADLNTNYGVNFIAGAEIVDNQSVVQLFNDLNQPLSVPAMGDKDYTFPIGNFFGLLGFLSGQHTFNMTVEDMQGNKKNGVLVLTVE